MYLLGRPVSFRIFFQLILVKIQNQLEIIKETSFCQVGKERSPLHIVAPLGIFFPQPKPQAPSDFRFSRF